MNKLRMINRADPGRTRATTKLVSLLSGKGGVGKTILGFNLAERMASLGRRVLLVDADFTTGNQHILANVACDLGIAEYADQGLTLEETVTSVSDRLDLLPSIRPPEAAERISGRAAAILIERLRSDSSAYDVVVLDHPSGVSETATVMAHASDIDLLVVIPELTSISDCYGLLKTLLAANRSIDCRLLINRAESENEATYIYQRFAALTEKFLEQRPGYLGYLLEDKSYRLSVASQSPMGSLEPDSAAVRALTQLTEKLASALGLPPGSAPKIVEKAINNYRAAAEIEE
ncbi:MAG: AAA family ATPase [candidate division Zixibacteria bacterium]|nr:AAA family ATPase [candidate division Zixibacteria bacterium]MCK4606002.1 AAA family ATPase [candidate division Zixibacteria bacterium]